MMNLGILTLPFEPNYGFLLQAFALQHITAHLGSEPYILCRNWNINVKPSLLYKFKRKVFYSIICRRIYPFYNKLNLTNIVRSSTELYNTCLSYNITKVIVGSDQVWRIENTRGASLDYYGGFISDFNKIKISSYAASFGTNIWRGTDVEKSKISALLKNFDFITVREDSGVEICKEQFNIGAIEVLDPTLLLDVSHYEKLISPQKTREDYIATYILDSTNEKLDFVAQLSSYYGLKVKALYKKTNFYYHSVEHWLKTIKEAKFVIVDSFHGMVFSILFQKNFVVIGNKKRGLTRFTSLLEKLNLKDRLIDSVSSYDNQLDQPIDYSNVIDRLNMLRAKSMTILSKIVEL